MGNPLSDFGKAFVPEKLFKKDIRTNLRKYLITAGYKDVPYEFFGMLFIGTAIITYFIFMTLILPIVKGKGVLGVFFVSFSLWAITQILLIFVIIFVIYFFLNIKIYKRTREIEEHLPDFLVLVSTNLKGGLSLEQALWAAIRPEFTLLSQEMTIVSKRVMTGNDLGEALQEFIDKYPSPSLQRNLSLIAGEIESGGRIVVVIEKIIDSLKKSKALKSEMSASTVSYMIFIGAIVVVIAPALFALAFQLLQIILGFTSSIGSSLSSSSSGMMPISFDVSLDVTDFKRFSVLALTLIGVCSSMIVSIIEKGDIKAGLKYIPAFTILSVFLYFVFMILLQRVFGGMI